MKILVAGKVGVGKSSLVNGLIGQNVATVGDTFESVTLAVTKYERHINGIDVIVFDTPGLSDPDPDRDDETLREITQKTEGTIDLLLICQKMTERIDQTDILIINKLKYVFTSTVWTNTLLVLTFANEVRLPHIRSQIDAPVQPDNEQEKLKACFEKKLSEFRAVFPKYLKDTIPAHFLKEIPVVPAGYMDSNLPGYDDWLSKFWAKAFTRVSESAKPALLRISEDRFMGNPNRERLPPYLQGISMQVIWGAIVGAALGKAVAKIKGMLLLKKDIEVIERECQNKGASLGARFVLFFRRMEIPLQYSVQWIVDQIDMAHFTGN